ncbi:MAG: hypothetical protein AAFQ21_12275 [Pseudomonadota bacterium]
MTLIRIACTALAATVLAGCVTTETTEPEPLPKQEPRPLPELAPAETPGFDEGLAVGKLPAQRLQPGQCGLFLFTPNPSPRFIFFAEAAGGVARMTINGREVTLARTSVDGSIVDQHYTEQSYRSAEDLSVAVTITPGDPADQGTRIPQGSVSVDRDDGWSIVLPVSGATSCQ